MTLGKITIHRKYYNRPRRRFRHHEEEAAEAHTVTESAQTEGESLSVAAAPVMIQEPVTAEPIGRDMPVAEKIEETAPEEAAPKPPDSRPADKRSRFSWLLLIPAFLLGIAVMLLWNLFQTAPEPKPAVIDPLTPTERAIQKTHRNVVSVVNMQKANNLLNESEVPAEVGIGSGVIYKLTEKEAYIVTNYHVIKDATRIQVTLPDNRKVTAKRVGSDKWTDLAVIKVPKGNISSKIEFADSDDIIVGQTAIAIGSPLSQTFAGSVSQGIISGLNRAVPVDLDGDGLYDWESNVIQTDAAINPGNSGGALVNDDGKLMGINAMKISLDNVEGISFAVPANDVKKLSAILETEHRIERPALGVQLQDMNHLQLDALKQQLGLPDDLTAGVMIMAVEPRSAAEAGGLQPQDIITQIEGKRIDGLVQFRKALYYDHKKGDTMDMTVFRQGQTKHMKVKLK